MKRSHHHNITTPHAQTHATHARSGVPVNQNPNLTPPNQYRTGLHDTAAEDH